MQEKARQSFLKNLNRDEAVWQKNFVRGSFIYNDMEGIATKEKNRYTWNTKKSGKLPDISVRICRGKQ